MNNRSEQNYQAGLALLRMGMYDQSVVCFYYSVLQQMMYSLNISKLRPIPYDEQNPLDENLPYRIFGDVVERIKSTYKNDISYLRENFLYGLLELRHKADYAAEEITQLECLDCREWCEGSRARLTKLFN